MDINTKMTKDEFINAFNEKYKGKYECRLSESVTEISPIDNIMVMCPKHGLFIENAYTLLTDMACFKCFTEEKWKENHI